MDQKTEAELKKEQEEADAALARQLQEEMDRQDEEQRTATRPPTQQRSNQTAASQPNADQDVLTVACPACTFLNEITKPVAGKKYACAQCRTPLPMPRNLPERKEEARMVECKVCHSVNRVPDKKSDAVLCGACYQQLGTEPLNTSAPPPSTAADEPEPEMRTVQIRCGQCSAVNAVQVSSSAKVVQFECGGCSTINEVNLS